MTQQARPSRGRRWLFVAALALAGGVLALRWLPHAPGPWDGEPTAEARLNVLQLCAAAQAWRQTHGGLPEAGPTPPEVPRGRAVPWPHDEAFHALGFEPGPRVRYQYEVFVQEDPVGAPEGVCTARGDLDGDGQNSLFRVTLDSQGLTSPVHVQREDE